MALPSKIFRMVGALYMALSFKTKFYLRVYHPYLSINMSNVNEEQANL